jgi:hypothetical protein
MSEDAAAAEADGLEDMEEYDSEDEEEDDEDDGPSFEFRFEAAKLLLELEDTTDKTIQVRSRPAPLLYHHGMCTPPPLYHHGMCTPPPLYQHQLELTTCTSLREADDLHTSSIISSSTGPTTCNALREHDTDVEWATARATVLL